MKDKQHKNWKSYLSVALLGLLAGSVVALSAGVQVWTPLRLPTWISSILFWLGIVAIIAYGLHVFIRQPFLSRLWVICAILMAMFFNGLGQVAAAYIGPQRTVTTTIWQRSSCDYRAYTPSPAGWCYLTLYYPPSSCPSTSCGTSWPGTCGSTISCTITLSSDTQSCTSGQTGCTSQTSTTTYPAATVSGTTVCTTPGNNGWCKGTATLNLSGNEPVGGYSLTYFEGSPGVLCNAPSCAWNFPEGSTNLNYWVHSTFGDTSTMSAASMKVDSIAPVLSLTIPSPDGANGWFISPATASAIAIDATSGVSGSPSINGGGSSFTASSDGIYNLTATVSDVAGNTATSSTTIHLDTTAPVAGFSLPAPDGQNGWYVSPVTVTPNGSDATSGIASQVVSLDNATWLPSLTVSTSGTQTIYERIVDIAGNTTTSSTTIKVDTTPPAAGFLLPAPDGQNGWYVSPVTVAPNGSDATSGIGNQAVSLDNANWSPFLAISTSGTYPVYERITDLAGNTTTSTMNVSVDTTPPSVTVTIPAPDAQNGWYTSQTLFSISESDIGSGVASTEYSVDGGTWQSTAPTLSDGKHSVLVRVTDLAGNITTTKATVNVDTVSPNSAFITPAEGTTTIVHGSITMAGATADATSGPAEAKISLDGGTTWLPLPLGTTGSWSYTWDTAHFSNGAHTILVRATDIAGNQEHTAQITIIVTNEPPSVRITPLWTVFGTADVSISAGSSPVSGATITVSDPDGRWPDAVTEYNGNNLPDKFSWLGRMGDGSIAYAGRYIVTVRAWDDYGNTAKATGWVLILLAPKPTPTSTPTSTTVPPTPEPTTTSTKQPAIVAVVPSATPVVQVVIPEPEPVKNIEKPVIQRILWPAFSFIGLLAILASASLSDRRPRELKALAKSMDTTREIQKSYPPED
jgi:hypothetical protein